MRWICLASAWRRVLHSTAVRSTAAGLTPARRNDLGTLQSHDCVAQFL